MPASLRMARSGSRQPHSRHQSRTHSWLGVYPSVVWHVVGCQSLRKDLLQVCWSPLAARELSSAELSFPSLYQRREARNRIRSPDETAATGN